MSSLPPYNPRLGDHGVWLLPVHGAGDLPDALTAPPAGWAAVFVDRQELAVAARALCPGATVTHLADPATLEVPGQGWSVVTGRPAFVEAILRQVMGLPTGTARFVIQPGAVSIIQLLADRALLVRLNDGRALPQAPA